MLGLQSLLLIGGHALVAENAASLLLSPAGGKVRLTLVAGVRLFGTGASRGSSWTQITFEGEKQTCSNTIQSETLLFF